MQVFSSPRDVFQVLDQLRRSGKSIGLVPTMGALHEGHLSLVGASQRDNDVTVVSLFVNPLQFNNSEDFQNYPRPFKEDKSLLKKNDIDILFAPEENDMYPEATMVKIDFGIMGRVMEGKHRPGHFDGVGLVVIKLLNLVSPDRAYFGLKDLQQYLLVSRLVRDFSIQTEIVGMPIAREHSGLAMSSRNLRLSSAGREKAANIYKGLKLAAQKIHEGQSIDETKKEVLHFYKGILELKIEYLEFVDGRNLADIRPNQSVKEVAICVAGYVEGIRLIDNLYLRQD